MSTIIQDFAKIINGRISKALLVYFGLLFCLSSGFMIGRMSKIIISKPEVRVETDGEADFIQNQQDLASGTSSNTASDEERISSKSLIFASSKGKYFYYKGCGGSNISKKNTIYYKSESQALAAGKILYAGCK